ncbi:YhcH/YjgK/YiaL family protein [Chitinophaga lutea]
MILDALKNAHLYHGLGPRFVKAFDYLLHTDFSKLEKGRYEIDGQNVVAIVNEYQTVDPAGEKMESHRKYIDVQYVVKGAEQIGIALLNGQEPSRAYDEESDYMLFSDRPSFFTRLQAGDFAIFFPTDLHMPNLADGTPVQVKKVVIKVAVN